MDHPAYITQSLCDRLNGLVLDAEHLSASMWSAGAVELSRRLEVLASDLATARVMFEHAAPA